jgi:hypothetical protein
MPVRLRACPGLETAYTNALQQPVREPWAAVAQKIQILLIDDLDGTAAEVPSGSGWTTPSTRPT